MEILKVVGISDDNNVKVLYNDGFFKEFALFFDGNSSFMENISLQDNDITTLYLGGEKQFKALNLKKIPNIIINMICDPEIQENSLNIFESIKFNTPILNKPENIRKTARDVLSLNLVSNEYFYIPKTFKIKPNNEKDVLGKAKELFGNKSFLFRPVLSHSGKALIKVDDFSKADFTKYLLDGENEYFITEFVNFVSNDGFYKKARFFVLDGKIYPRHLIVSKSWKIHSGNRVEFENETKYKKEESDFLSSPPKIFLDFCKYVYEFLNLDFFGIDCAILPDGKVVLFEANVCMRPFANHNEKYLQDINEDLKQKFIELLYKKAK